MKPQFIKIPPAELLRRLEDTHGKSKSYHFYPWVTKARGALDGRELTNLEREELAKGSLKLGSRDLKPFLDNWSPLKEI